MPTAKPPIQSSSSGLMKSARHMFARPSRFLTCWRRKGRRVQSLPARTSTSSPSRLQRHSPTVAFGVTQRSAMMLVEHRLRVLEQVARAFADHGIVEDGRISAGQFPCAEEGRPVDRRLQIAQRPFAELVKPGPLRRRRLAGGIERKGVGARFLERGELALARSARATCAACRNHRRYWRSAARAGYRKRARRRPRPRGWRRGRG